MRSLYWLLLILLPRQASGGPRKQVVALFPRTPNKLCNLMRRGAQCSSFVVHFPSPPINMTANARRRCQWRVRLYSAKIHHHCRASVCSRLDIRCLVFWVPRSSVNMASYPERTYIPRVPASVCCSLSLSYTPLSKIQPGKTNDILFLSLESEA